MWRAQVYKKLVGRSKSIVRLFAAIQSDNKVAKHSLTNAFIYFFNYKIKSQFN